MFLKFEECAPSSSSHLFEVIRSDVVNGWIEGGLLQTAEASLQSSYKALPQVVHRADELVGHSLIQAHHDQLLDLVDAGLDVLRRNRLSVWRYDDVCRWRRRNFNKWMTGGSYSTLNLMFWSSQLCNHLYSAMTKTVKKCLIFDVLLRFVIKS